MSDIKISPQVSERAKEDILDFFTGKVAKWWIPDEIIFLKELPHGATGKLLKFDLREEYKNLLIDQQ